MQTLYASQAKSSAPEVFETKQMHIGPRSDSSTDREKSRTLLWHCCGHNQVTHRHDLNDTHVVWCCSPGFLDHVSTVLYCPLSSYPLLYISPPTSDGQSEIIVP